MTSTVVVWVAVIPPAVDVALMVEVPADAPEIKVVIAFPEASIVTTLVADKVPKPLGMSNVTCVPAGMKVPDELYTVAVIAEDPPMGISVGLGVSVM